jgi:hypothetical protein
MIVTYQKAVPKWRSSSFFFFFREKYKILSFNNNILVPSNLLYHYLLQSAFHLLSSQYSEQTSHIQASDIPRFNLVSSIHWLDCTTETVQFQIILIDFTTKQFL